ncbi:MAG: transcriptional regulator [Acidobacteria bacterium CG_4_9_14_3_um_filter_49_7]|nr:MAG: transcriptional regulator [Acidobacteria bacterium CG_4_9_14_3_um_filter_49_7]
MKSRWIIPAILVILAAIPSANAVELGQVPPTVQLSGEKGGRVDGTPWSSTEIKGKVYTLMYVDPDAKNMNIPTEKGLKAQNFPKDLYGSIAIINMEATWKPNIIINKILKGKQKDYPDTIYARDMDFYISKAWKLKKNGSYAVLCFDRDGKLIFLKDGKLSPADTQDLIGIIRKALEPAPEETPPVEQSDETPMEKDGIN